MIDGHQSKNEETITGFSSTCRLQSRTPLPPQKINKSNGLRFAFSLRSIVTILEVLTNVDTLHWLQFGRAGNVKPVKLLQRIENDVEIKMPRHQYIYILYI